MIMMNYLLFSLGHDFGVFWDPARRRSGVLECCINGRYFRFSFYSCYETLSYGSYTVFVIP